MRMLNQVLYKQLIRGFEQQLWFFGQDTESREHNLFEKYGFHRFRTPGHRGSSRYKMPWGNRIIELHSYCVGIYGNNQDGFIYIRGNDQAYAYLGKRPPLPGRYRETFLMRPTSKESKERFFHASSDFLRWLEHYESWIDTTIGKGYRQSCYKRYHRKWLPPDQARKWFQDYRNLEIKVKTVQAA